MMKNGLIGFAVFGLLLVGSLAIGFGSQAKDPGFEDRFAGDTKTEGGSGAYQFDKAHSSIGFRVVHMGLVEVPGYFRDFTGTVNYDASDIKKSTVQFSAKTTSIDTGVAARDRHLRTADFFDVEKFPEMSFKSSSVTKKGKEWMLNGDLTMRGVTKEISFPFKIVGFYKDDKVTKIGVSAETVVNRRDFGVNYGSNLPNGVPMLSDNIKVVIQIEGNMPAAK